MGNQISSETEEVATVQTVQSNSRRIHKREVSQPRRAPKSKIRLVPLSGSPSTSSYPNENSNHPLTTVSNNPRPTIITNQSQMYHISPNQQRPVDQLSEEEQIKIAQRLGLIQHLPKSVWDTSQIENKKMLECCICMMDFENEDPIRYLPCMHYYHMDCIDDWLMRSFTCPTCMEPVDAALLSSFSNSAAIES